MKRWTNVLGRVGTVLIAISLALLLVSLIPQIQMQHSVGGGPLSAGESSVVFNHVNLNPQQEVALAVTVEGKATVYLLELFLEFRIGPGIFEYGFNVTDLQENPDLIIWEHEVENGDYKRSYTPTRVMNATIVVYNELDSEMAYLEYEMTLRSALAPKEKVRTIAYFAAPIGVILAIPWLVNIWKQRKQN
ncbi:MAG: hypothetical protein PVH73_05125 [Candidatus Bathyarchaeota archaeon]|jgi:hypothetical protein